MTISTVVFFGLLFLHKCSPSILDWFTFSKPILEEEKDGVPLLNIPFEELKPEEKFLFEASKITGLKMNQLDACQHKLIMKLKASCGSLSDEELAKLSVNLLNCQADLEGRKTYPCNEDMSLRECTTSMDPETWNAYHIMSNRARAVCYVARQEQFRALAEMTVNRLASSARSHLQQMDIINANQQQLEKALEFALSRLSRSQHDVLSMYTKLKRLEFSFAASLNDDKVAIDQIGILVDKESKKINLVFSDFKKTLEEAVKDFRTLKDIESAEHRQVVSDLLQTQKVVEEINKHLDKINSMSLEYLRKSAVQNNVYEKQFEALNKSLTFIFGQLKTLEKITNDKTLQLLSYIGAEGENLSSAFMFTFHMICLLVAMVVSSFLRLPNYLRFLLMVTAVFNSYLTLQNHAYSLPLSLLYLTLSSITLVDWAIVLIRKMYQRRHKDPDHRTSFQGKRTQVSNVVQNGTFEPYSKVNEWISERDGKFNDLTHHVSTEEPVSPLSSRNQDEISETSESRSSSSKLRKKISPARSLTGSSYSGRRPICSATCINGLRCKLLAVQGLSTCRVHQEQR